MNYSLEPIYTAERSIKQLNNHWVTCKQQQTPYLTVKRNSKASTINWDLWCIDITNLCLNDKAAQQLTAYINELFERKLCYEAVTNTTTTGYLKIKKQCEGEALRTVWQIVANPKNWQIRIKDEIFPNLSKRSQEWLTKKQMETQQ